MSNEDFDKDKILSRVKKMLALGAADSGATEGERDNALRMAQNLLAKYNLTLSEAQASGSKKDEEQRGSGVLVGRDYPWMRTCAFAIAELFFCNYFFIRQRGGKVQHYFVGRESNVATAQAMTTYVIDSIDREAMKAARAAMGSFDSNYWRSFCKGAAARLYTRCQNLRAEAEEESAEERELDRLNKTSSSTALVLATVYAVEKKANEEFIFKSMGINDLKADKSRQRNTSRDAHSEGQKYGDRINLNQQLGGSDSKRKKLT